MQVHDRVAHRINFHLTHYVYTPKACQKVSYGEGTDQLLNLRFETEVEAYECYKEYAAKCGFGVWKSSISKNKNGIVRSRTYWAGFKKDRLDAKAKWPCEDTRMGYPAYINLKLEADGLYTFTWCQANHNHKCMPKKSYMFKSQRHISIAQAYEGDLADSVGIRPKTTYDLMCVEARGSENFGFLSIDYKNYL